MLLRWARIGADCQRPARKLPLRLSSNHLAAAGTMKEFITEAATGYGRAANRAGYSSAT